MKFLKCYHFGYLSFNKNSSQLYAGVDIDSFVNYTIENDKILLAIDGKFINYSDNSFQITRIPFKFNIYNNDGKIYININGKFLSCLPNGNISFVDQPREWEGFMPDDFSGQDFFQANLAFYCSKNQIRKLACCCNDVHYGNGSWFLTDLNENSKNDIFSLDISKKFPIPEGVFDYIFIEHGLEHIEFDGVINFCKESFRCLKPNGILRISSPSLDNWIKYYIIENEFNDSVTKHVMRSFFKTANSLGIMSKALAINNVMHNWSHKCILDYITYKEILQRTGFTDIKQVLIHHSEHQELNDIESRHDSYSEFETLCIEAGK